MVEMFNVASGWSWKLRTTSANCYLVQKPYTNLEVTAVNLTSASKYFEMLPGLCGAKQSALRLCKDIPTGL
jgi:hypothetical protein